MHKVNPLKIQSYLNRKHQYSLAFKTTQTRLIFRKYGIEKKEKRKTQI